MFTGMEMMACADLAVPADVMSHVVNVESGRNPYAIGVVGARLVRQPRGLAEAVATVRMLEEKGYNYSLGAAQVNRSNLKRFGLDTTEKAFDLCLNLRAGSRILHRCYLSADKDWGKAFSCYYSGNFTTGFEHGYVQRIFASMGKRRRPDNYPLTVIPVGPASTQPAENHSPEPISDQAVASAQRDPRGAVARTPATDQADAGRPFRPVVRKPGDPITGSAPTSVTGDAPPPPSGTPDVLADDRAPTGDGAFVF